MTTLAVDQAANVHPPRRGGVVALEVDSTARAYSTVGLALGGYTPDGSNSRPADVFLALEADGGDVYYYFGADSTADLDDNAKISAGGTLALTNSHGAKLSSGAVHEVKIQRHVDKYLVVKSASGTPILRMWAICPST